MGKSVATLIRCCVSGAKKRAGAVPQTPRAAAQQSLTRDQSKTEASGSTAGGHYTKTDKEVETIVEVEPVAVRTAHEALRVVKRTTAHHATPARGRLFSAILRVIGIAKIWFSRILTPETACPFPHIPRHLQRAVGAGAFGKDAHGAGTANPRFAVIRVFTRQFLTPGIASAIGATRGLLPLGFAGQPHRAP